MMGGMKDLFGDWGEAYARTSDPDTSHAAAESMKPIASDMEMIAYEAIKRAGAHGLTNDGLVEATGLDWETITPRVAPLLRKGFVKTIPDPSTGKPIKRLGKSGRLQRVVFAK